MTDVNKQKEALVTGILLRLSKSYSPYSKVHQTVREGLLKKLSQQELSALYAMVLTATSEEKKWNTTTKK